MTTFWGVILEGGKRYKQTVESQFHLTMAALDPNSVEKSAKHVSVMVENNGTEYLICNLHPEKSLQERLDLMFGEGEEISLFTTGKATVHLTGYIMPDEDFDDLEDEDIDEEEEEIEAPALNGKRKKPEQLALPGKKLKVDEPKKQAIVDIDPIKELEKNKPKNKQPAAQQPKAQQPQQKKPVKPVVADEDDDDDDQLDVDSDIDSEELDKMMAEAESDDDLDEEDDFEDDDDDEDDDDLEGEDSEDEKLKNVQQKLKGKLNGQVGKPVAQTPNKAQQQNQHPKQQQKQQPKQQQNAQTPKKPQQNQSKTPQQPQNQPKTPQQQPKSGNKDQHNRQQTPFVKGNKPQNQQGQENSNKKGTPFQKNKSQSPGSQNKGDNSVLENTSDKPIPVSKPSVNKLPNGLVIQDIHEGTGPEAKKGKFLHMGYIGRLTNNKVFDQSGKKPFSFRLGMGQVIKGWDQGIQGMKVGGKRRLIVPSSLAYGKSGAGEIPPNAQLIFDVELKKVQ